ncbi:FHA domain-containing protein [Microcella sp.]|uniref:FHA domain-containing protein n=1 Tax=Microcella sp. TaxID=1913979 RepID=UPI003F729899
MDDRPEQVDDTVLRPRAPHRHIAPPVEPDLDDTIIRLVEPPAARPAPLLPTEALAVVEPPAPPSPVEWAMRVRGTTTVVPLDLPVIIGRRPGGPRPTEHPVPRRVVIPADRADVSARHARIERIGHTLVVSDLGSTNGVVVHWSTGSILRLRPAESCAVLPDAIIVLGDGVEIEFVAPAESPITPLPSEHS